MKFVINMLLGLLVTLALSSVSLASQQAIDSGKDAFKQGQFEKAAHYWEQARQHISKNDPKYVDISVSLAAAYQAIGLVKKAENILDSVLPLTTGDSARSAKVLMQLSDVYVAMRDFQDKDLDCRMKEELRQKDELSTRETLMKKALDSLEDAQAALTSVDPEKNRYPMLWANLLNKKGNILLVEAIRLYKLGKRSDKFNIRKDWKNDIINYYNDSLKLADQIDAANLRAKISLNIIRGAVQLDDVVRVRAELKDKAVLQKLVELLPSHEKAVAFIDIGHLMLTAFERSSKLKVTEKHQAYQYAHEALKKAREIAIEQRDNQAIGYANLYLAQIYAEQSRYDEIAKQITQEALSYVQSTPVYSNNNERLSHGESFVPKRFRLYLPSLLDGLPKEKCREICEGFSPLSVQTQTFTPFFSEHCQGTCQDMPPLFLQNYQPELLVRLERQLGQLWKKQGQRNKDIEARNKAIKAYKRAIQHTQFANEYRSITPSVGDLKEDVYFELADLLLQQIPIDKTDENQAKLKNTLDFIEALKKIEVQNYFQDECITELKESVINVEQFLSNKPNVAVFYSLLFEDRIELLLVSKNGIKRKAYPSTQSRTNFKKAVRATINELKTGFSAKGASCKTTGNSEAQVYEWFRPLLDELDEQIDTLIIVPDDKFYDIPFAALYDQKEQRFLIEKYALIITPGIKLITDKKPKQRDTGSYVLLNGLSVNVGGFDKLCKVPTEIMKLSFLLGGNTKVFDEQASDKDAFETCLKEREKKCQEEIDPKEANRTLLECLNKSGIEYPKGIDILQDQEFTVSNLNNKFSEELKNPYSIVHFATHGEFKQDKSFLQTYQGKITMGRLRELIRENNNFGSYRDDLLTLSACKTAATENGSATFGLASEAISVGVPTVLATSWIADDVETVELMTDFYSNYLGDSSLSKARALQKAQIKLLNSEPSCGQKGEKQYKPPYYWAPFLLIGNGLTTAHK